MAKEKEFKPDFLKEESFESDIPWLWPEMLDTDASVRWSWSWKVETLTFTRASSVWTWDQSFTWFSFTPTHYTILAWRDATWLECISHAWIDADWTQWWTSIRPNWASQIESANTTSVFRVFFTNAWGWDTRATHVSLDSGWITVNVAASAENIKLTITCYW